MIEAKRFTSENNKYYLGNSAALHDLFHHNKKSVSFIPKAINDVNFIFFISNNKAIKEFLLKTIFIIILLFVINFGKYLPNWQKNQTFCLVNFYPHGI